MSDWDKMKTVSEMQNFILNHFMEDTFPFKELYGAAGYSKRNADRIFAEFFCRTPAEYIRSLKLSHSAKSVAKKEGTILTVAMDAGYNSHEGYTKAFVEQFGITPSKYRKGKSFIPLFMPYPIRSYHQYDQGKETNIMNGKILYCTVSAQQRPKRKLILQYAKKANGYWEFCEENGCGWEGLLNSIPSRFDTAAILRLPKKLVKQGFGSTACGIEVPYEYDGEIPAGYDVLELPPCDMLVFQSQPYEKEEESGFCIGGILKAEAEYDYAAYGWEKAEDDAPFFNYGAEKSKGARLAVPVKRK